MPFVQPGEGLPKSSDNFTRLKTPGDKIQFRILGLAYREGNHFFQKDGKWDVQPCVRLNSDGDCPHCDKLFEVLRAIPKTDDSKKYNKLRDEAKKTVPGCDPGITYNFPVINRETESFTIFQATPGIRTKIDSDVAVGIKVLDVDFVAVNTGKTGKDRYAVSRMDSADTNPLTAREEKIKAEYSPSQLEALINGTPDEDSAVAFEANSEVNLDDIPVDF